MRVCRLRQGVSGEWRKDHKEKFYDLYFLPNTSTVAKSSSTKRAGHIACMGSETRTEF
jgi:hypothetical protein